VEEVTNQFIDEHNVKTTVKKENNSDKSGKIIVSSKLKILFNQWKGITKLLKLKNKKTEIIQDTIRDF
jgi:hypothetical protein